MHFSALVQGWAFTACVQTPPLRALEMDEYCPAMPCLRSNRQCTRSSWNTQHSSQPSHSACNCGHSAPSASSLSAVLLSSAIASVGQAPSWTELPQVTCPLAGFADIWGLPTCVGPQHECHGPDYSKLEPKAAGAMRSLKVGSSLGLANLLPAPAAAGGRLFASRLVWGCASRSIYPLAIFVCFG